MFAALKLHKEDIDRQLRVVKRLQQRPKAISTTGKTRRSLRLMTANSVSTIYKRTRSKKSKVESDNDEDKENDDEAEFNDNVLFSPKKRRKVGHRPQQWSYDPNQAQVKPEDVTEADLDNVATHYSDKSYDKRNGSTSTCHQCRQKTSDMKTICRSGHCVGVRGQFCGVCLKNRYGENAKEALKDPNWSCPPCLDVCNCSICRNRIGKGATGPLTYLALSKGFASVKDFLLNGLKK